LQRQLHASLRLGDLPFVVGRGPVAREGLPPLRPDLKLDDTVPFRLSRNHFMIEKRDGIIMCATSAARLERSSTPEPAPDPDTAQNWWKPLGLFLGSRPSA
jgi:hypothetical protein